MTDLAARIVVDRPDGFRVDVDVVVPAGTTAALLGPNGAGKSTIVGAIAGLERMRQGRVSIGDIVLDDTDQRVSVPAAERDLGVVFQGGMLFPHMTARENVMFPLRSRGVAVAAARDAAGRWLAALGVDGLGERLPTEISGGEAQRVALARALVAEPAALLLDEPMSALDVRARTELRHVLSEHLALFPGPRLLITHDPAEAFLLADTIHVVESGLITQAGTPDDIRLRPRTRYAAELAGVNLLEGVAEGGMVEVDGLTLDVADEDLSGPVLVAVPPNAVSVHRQRPSGSPRNSWLTSVERIESLGIRVRLRTAAPVPLTVEVTRRAADDLGLTPGAPVWVAFKATEVSAELR